VGPFPQSGLTQQPSEKSPQAGEQRDQGMRWQRYRHRIGQRGGEGIGGYRDRHL